MEESVKPDSLLNAIQGMFPGKSRISGDIPR